MHHLLVATRKGLFLLFGGRRARAAGPSAGPISSAIWSTTPCSTRATGGRCSPRRAPAISGPRSSARRDLGATWQEAARPPAFRTAAQGEKGYVVDHVFWLAPGHASQPGVWYAGSSPPGLFRSEDGGEHLAAGRGLQRPPDVRDLGRRAPGRHARRPEAPLDPRRPARPGTPLRRPLRGRRRRAGERRRGRRLEAAERRQPRRLPPRPLPRVRPGSPLRPAPSPRARRAVAAEPLRDLPDGPARGALGARRRGDAEGRRRHRLPDRPPSPRSGDGLGVPDGRQRRLAAHLAGRAARGLRDARRRQELAAAGPRPSARSRPGSP